VIEHHLKTWPIYYDAIERGEKTFEVRDNPRAFFATGGWSGAELLISAMRRHWQIWKHVQSWERGGLYVVDAKSRAMG
jgi:hypothetical protein